MSARNGDSSRPIISAARDEKNSDPVPASDCSLSGRKVPDIEARLARIALLQHAIRSGTYHVPAEAVAEKVVQRLTKNPAQPASTGIRMGSK